METTAAVATEFPIMINKGAKVHFGNKSGAFCGAGFNHQGIGRGVEIYRVKAEVTCLKCAKLVQK
jgi:hypothetical protein